MVTIVNSRKLMDMLPPLDYDTALTLEVNKRKERLEAEFNKVCIWLGVFAILYVTIRCYLS